MDTQTPALLPTDRIRMYVACRHCSGSGYEPHQAPSLISRAACRQCLNGTSNPSQNRGVFETWVTVAELVGMTGGQSVQNG